MTLDIAVVGDAFLDLTFGGLPRVPAPGEELVARTFFATPGGAAMQAVGAARLGLSVGLVGRIGNDFGGELLRDLLGREGIRTIGSPAHSTSTTALLATTDGGVAMASVLSPDGPSAADVASAGAPAVVTSLGRLPLAPPGVRAYAVTGSLELPGAWTSFERSGRRVHALVMNHEEAFSITGRDDPESEARALAEHARTAVVTLGPEGAVGVSNGEIEWAPGIATDVADATGAGDLFVSTYVWADLHGAGLRERVAWSVLAASLSVQASTALDGAVHLDTLLEEGRRRGLTPP